MRIAYHKLVRDQIPGIIAANGGQPATRILDHAITGIPSGRSWLRRPVKRRQHRTGNWHRNWLTSWKYSGLSPWPMT